MKSINTYIAEATAKVEQAYEAEDRFIEINDQMNDDNIHEIASRLIEASEAKNKALRQALKAVKDLYELFELEAPRLHFLSDARGGLGHITLRWEYMNRVFEY